MLGSILLGLVLTLANPTSSQEQTKQTFRQNNEISDTTYKQSSTSISDTASFLLEHGSEFKKVCLIYTDDQLLQVVKDNCPNLTALSIVGDFFLMDRFTDNGLKTIACLPHLSSFELHVQSSSITLKGIKSLLEKQTNLQELYLGVINDQCLNVIHQYNHLKSLGIESSNLSQAALETFFQSISVQATLQSLDLNIYAPLSDLLLATLSNYTQLTSLSLDSRWNSKTQSQVALIKALPKLRKLKFAGCKIKPQVAAEIGKLSKLRQLSLGNCSLLSQDNTDDFNIMLENLTKLNVLELFQCDMFSYKNCEIVANMPLRKLSIGGSYMMYNDGLKTLCNSTILQKTLKSLYLIQNSSIDNYGYGELSKLSLKTLRLQDCPWFNDTSMNLMMAGNLINSLEGLELEEVFISDASLGTLQKCSNLNTLMFVRNNAVTVDGIKQILATQTLWKSLKNLYFAEVTFTKEMIQNFAAFDEIHRLAIVNCMGFDFLDNGSDFFHLPNIKKNHAIVTLMLGSLLSWEQFINP